MLGNSFRCCAVDHLVFMKQSSNDCVILTVYVDDILLICSDISEIKETKKDLSSLQRTWENPNMLWA